MALLRYLYFDDNRKNLLVYFTITTLILYIGPERIMPSMKHLKYDENVPLIETPLGKISGTMLKTRLERNIFAYRSIPYAKPPIKELRFQKPEPVKPWKGILDAHSRSPPCVQPSPYIFMPIIGQEDCLHLNVFVPDTEKGNT